MLHVHREGWNEHHLATKPSQLSLTRSLVIVLEEDKKRLLKEENTYSP